MKFIKFGFIIFIISFFSYCNNNKCSISNDLKTYVEKTKNRGSVAGYANEPFTTINKDTLKITYYTDSVDYHTSYMAFFFENLVYKHNYNLSKFEYVILDLVNPYKGSKIVYEQKYNKNDIANLMQRFSSDIIHVQISNYFVDSITYYDLYNYNNTLLKMYKESKKSKYNKDFIYIFDKYIEESIHNESDTVNTQVINMLYEIISDNEYSFDPKLIRHLKDMINFGKKYKSTLENTNSEK